MRKAIRTCECENKSRIYAQYRRIRRERAMAECRRFAGSPSISAQTERSGPNANSHAAIPMSLKRLVGLFSSYFLKTIMALGHWLEGNMVMNLCPTVGVVGDLPMALLDIVSGHPESFGVISLSSTWPGPVYCFNLAGCLRWPTGYRSTKQFTHMNCLGRRRCRRSREDTINNAL